MTSATLLLLVALAYNVYSYYNSWATTSKSSVPRNEWKKNVYRSHSQESFSDRRREEKLQLLVFTTACKIPDKSPLPENGDSCMYKQENPAVARKPRDAAAVLFSLKFADDIHYNFKSSQASKSKARLQSSKLTYRHKTDFNAKWRFKVIQSHVFWSQWKGDKALSNTV